jgi:protoporphyrinogen oxidase
VHRVIVKDGRAIGLQFENGEERLFDQVISTMPLNLLVTRLPHVPDRITAAAKSLRFRNTILVYLKVESTRLFKDNWLYIHSPELQTGRITNFRNWAPQLYGNEKSSILALEYWCNNEDPLWSEQDERLIELATTELNKTGLTNKAVVSAGYVHRIPRCYPVYVRGYKAALEPVEQYLREINGLTVIGRYGSFKYNNQDHSILMGVLAAENIVQNARLHDLWQINTDYEYQESAVISRTGLVREPAKERGLSAPAPVPSAA